MARGPIATFVSIGLAAFPTAASGQSACVEPTTTLEMHRCAAEAATRVDSLLESLELDLGARSSPEAKAAWLRYRELQCRHEASSVAGGSLEPIARLSCSFDLAAERLRRMASLLCEGGGATGDCPASRRYVERLEQLDHL